MNYTEKIKLRYTEISEEKCESNFAFWRNELMEVNESDIKEHLVKSNTILPCHTLAYERVSDIFFSNTNSKTIMPEAIALLSLELRHKRMGVPISNNAPFMKDSLNLGHEVFLFAYHNVHNPYHRKEDQTPIRPIGLFLKKEIEKLTYVHGSPCDIATKNVSIDNYRAEHLDKFYLCPQKMRELKSYQIKTDSYLKESFEYYYGDPEIWKIEKGYGMRLFERAGEFRYLNYINPEHIEAVLWPFWYDNDEVMDRNLDLFSEFKKKYPEIKRIQYNVDTHINNWQLSFVEASYYSQMYYLKFENFEDNAQDAKIKLLKEI